VDRLIHDVKYAVRSILTSPKFALVVLLTLALGIGANTAVFSVLNAVVLKPLPYPEPEQLVRVYHSVGSDNTYLTGLAAIDYRDRSRTLEIAVTSTYSVAGADLTGETYIGADRREAGAVTLKGGWRTDRQFVELRRPAARSFCRLGPAR
jgi:hypothetical protein